MNANFRNPEFVKRYEYNYYDLETPLTYPANAQFQEKKNYRFTVDNSSEANPIDWYNAYLEVGFKLTKKADNTATTAADAVDNDNKNYGTTNAQTFIKEIQVECNGVTVYNNSKANETSNVLSLLKYTKTYAETIAQDQFYFIDDNGGAADARPDEAATLNTGFAKRQALLTAANINNVSIPLNLYGYFAAFKNNLHPNIKTNIILELETDDNIVFRSAAANQVCRVVITQLRLWCPKIVFNGEGMKKYLDDYLKPKKWSYLKELQENTTTQAQTNFFRISTGIRRPRHVFIWVTNDDQYNSQVHNMFTFNTFATSGTVGRTFGKAQLEVNNSIYYPQLDLTGEQKSRLYRRLMSFSSAYIVFLSGSIIDRKNFQNLYGILYFDLRNQQEDIKNNVVSLTFRYELNGAVGADYRLNSLVLHESDIELYTSSGKLLIKT